MGACTLMDELAYRDVIASIGITLASMMLLWRVIFYVLCRIICLGGSDPAGVSPFTRIPVKINERIEWLTVHHSDDLVLVIHDLCKRHNFSDEGCVQVRKALYRELPPRGFIFPYSVKDLRTNETYVSELIIHNNDNLSDIRTRWCREHGYEDIQLCVREWGPGGSMFPVLYSFAMVGDDFNLGDMSAFIISAFYGRKAGIHVMKIFSHEGIKIPCLFTVGSLLNWIHAENPCTFIGTGMIGIPTELHPIPTGLDVRGVRGPLTSSLIPSETSIASISDPALLVSRLFPRFDFESYPIDPTIPSNSEISVDEFGRNNRVIDAFNKSDNPLSFSDGQKEIGFIIHSADRTEFFAQYPHCRPYLIDNHQPSMTKFLSELLQYQRVLSSSLHGLVFAHSYNIPAAVFKVGNNIFGGDFKFIDYYHSLNNKDFTTRASMSDIWFNDRTLLKNAAVFVDQFWQPARETITALQDRQEALLMKYMQEIKDKYKYADPITAS